MMRLTVFSNYSVRMLIYLAQHPDRFVTIAEVAAAYGVSANHLMKVTQRLAAAGLVTTLRGAKGGLRLAKDASAITVGEVIRATDQGIMLGDGLPEVFDQAALAFMAVLDGCSLAHAAQQKLAVTQAGDSP